MKIAAVFALIALFGFGHTAHAGGGREHVIFTAQWGENPDYQLRSNPPLELEVTRTSSGDHSEWIQVRRPNIPAGFVGSSWYQSACSGGFELGYERRRDGFDPWVVRVIIRNTSEKVLYLSYAEGDRWISQDTLVPGEWWTNDNAQQGFVNVTTLFGEVCGTFWWIPQNATAPTPTNTPTSTPTPSATPTNTVAPTATATPVQLPVGNQIDWNTDTVSLHADNFYILADGKLFGVQASDLQLHSDPGWDSYTTLEAIWHEQGVEMRLFIYFGIHSGTWWLDETRTYNGRSPGDWIYYAAVSGNSTDYPLVASTFENVVRTNPAFPDVVPGTIHFDGLRLQPFFRQQSTPTPTPVPPIISNTFWDNGQLIVVGWNFRPAGVPESQLFLNLVLPLARTTYVFDARNIGTGNWTNTYIRVPRMDVIPVGFAVVHAGSRSSNQLTIAAYPTVTPTAAGSPTATSVPTATPTPTNILASVLTPNPTATATSTTTPNRVVKVALWFDEETRFEEVSVDFSRLASCYLDGEGVAVNVPEGVLSVEEFLSLVQSLNTAAATSNPAQEEPDFRI